MYKRILGKRFLKYNIFVFIRTFTFLAKAKSSKKEGNLAYRNDSILQLRNSS